MRRQRAPDGLKEWRSGVAMRNRGGSGLRLPTSVLRTHTHT